MRILKYNISDKRTHQIPEGSRILTAQIQHGAITVWALVDEDQEKIDYNFSVVPTGMNIDNDLKKFHYINTVQEAEGALIWHIFVDKPQTYQY